MKADLEIPEVKGVTIAIGRTKLEDGTYEWRAFLINQNDFPLFNVLISSKGYGEISGEMQKTSVLRQHFKQISSGVALVELLDPAVFNLCNEFWVSYYLDEKGGKIFDKKFLFMPGSLYENNLRYLSQIQMEGILHT